MKFQHHYNRDQYPRKYEVNKLPSKTVPDETMTVSELVRRFNHGLPITGNVNGQFYGDEELMPDLKKMDLSEIHAMQKKVREDIAEIRERVAKARTEKFYAKLKEKYKADLEAEGQKDDSQGSQAKPTAGNPTVPL